MPKIEFDKEKCIRCGACVKDCLTYSIEQNEEGFAQTALGGEERCIACQHCFAICPTGAITFNQKDPQTASKPNFGNPEEILNLIKSRRSIRQYTDEEVSNEVLDKLKEMLPYIPTGCNYNSLHFSFIESKVVMDEIREYTRKKLLKLLSNKFTQKIAGKFAKYQEAFSNGEDIIYRNAPHMIVVSSSIKAPCSDVDPIIALSYIELYAQSLGLGTCWCGFAQACFKILPKLSAIVDIPEDYKPVYVMLLGKPAVKYQRTIIPESFPISEIGRIKIDETDWLQKLKRIFINLIK